jgi:tRNA(fMet)-specific endonuclease VapC
VTLRFLLDTNILSEPLRPCPNPQVIELLRQHQDTIATATIVLHELWFGCYRLPDSKKRRYIEEYLREEVEKKLPILPYDTQAAKWHAQARATLSKLGQTPPFRDGQIAAVAQVNHLKGVTHSVSDFTPFRDLEVEDWFSAKN